MRPPRRNATPRRRLSSRDLSAVTPTIATWAVLSILMIVLTHWFIRTHPEDYEPSRCAVSASAEVSP